MAAQTHPMLTNYQVSLLWPAHRRRGGLFSRASALLRLWYFRLRERDELARFDARALRDIGRTEIDRQRELAKWFWQE